MIYHRQVISGEKGESQHLSELYLDAENSTENIHPQYNNIKSNYTLLNIGEPFTGIIVPSVSGRDFPFKILQDEIINLSFDVTGSNPVNGISAYVRLMCKGEQVYYNLIEATVGTVSYSLDIEINGIILDGYIFLGIFRDSGYSGSATINNLIIS